MGEREDILHDVKKLKDEIKEFQSKIMHEPYVKGYSNQEQDACSCVARVRLFFSTMQSAAACAQLVFRQRDLSQHVRIPTTCFCYYLFLVISQHMLVSPWQCWAGVWDIWDCLMLVC